MSARRRPQRRHLPSMNHALPLRLLFCFTVYIPRKAQSSAIHRPRRMSSGNKALAPTPSTASPLLLLRPKFFQHHRQDHRSTFYLSTRMRHNMRGMRHVSSLLPHRRPCHTDSLSFREWSFIKDKRGNYFKREHRYSTP